jgi:translation initiation factor IF-2
MAPEEQPAPGHLIPGTRLDGGLDDDVDSIAVTSSRTGEEPAPKDAEDAEVFEDLDAPEDRRRPPADPRARTVRLSPSAASGRSKGLIAAAVAGVLVVGGAVAATVGGGSGQGPDKSAAPTAGLVGRQASSSGDGLYAGGATDSSPWVWQTGQSTAGSPGATTGGAAKPGAPKPTGASSGPGGAQPSGPGMPQRSASAPGAPSGSVPPASSAGAPPTTPPPATVTLIAGPGCPNPAAGGYDAVGSGADSGWGSNGTGGWSGGGCDGSMQSMPMTGDATNGGNHALWVFGSGTAGFASCVVSVYVPWDGKATDTGGTAAEYQITEGSTDTVVTAYTVNQNAKHGQWVTLGTVKVGAGNLKLRLFDHGVDYPAGWRYGVAAARSQCTA